MNPPFLPRASTRSLTWAMTSSGVPKWKHPLGVYAAAPEDQLVAVLPLKPLRSHAGRLHGGELHRIQAVKAHLHKIIQQVVNAAAGMIVSLPVCVVVDPVITTL